MTEQCISRAIARTSRQFGCGEKNSRPEGSLQRALILYILTVIAIDFIAIDFLSVLRQ